MEGNKQCVLYDRECTNCGECDICDLNPNKICDNCEKCLDIDKEYREYKLESLGYDDIDNETYGCRHGDSHNHNR